MFKKERFRWSFKRALFCKTVLEVCLVDCFRGMFKKTCFKRLFKKTIRRRFLNARACQNFSFLQANYMAKVLGSAIPHTFSTPVFSSQKKEKVPTPGNLDRKVARDDRIQEPILSSINLGFLPPLFPSEFLSYFLTSPSHTRDGGSTTTSSPCLSVNYSSYVPSPSVQTSRRMTLLVIRQDIYTLTLKKPNLAHIYTLTIVSKPAWQNC